MKTAKPSTLIAVLASFLLVTAGPAFAASAFKKVNAGTLHVPSGVILPPRVGAFRLDHTKVYGSGGRDAGAEYNLGRVIRGDVYIYPLGTYGKDFNAELRVQQNAINQLNKSVKLVAQSRLSLMQSGRNLSGTRVQYELTRPFFGGKTRRCGSQLYLFADGRWLIQYRFSYPIEQSASASKQIADFLRLWQWRAQGNLVHLNLLESDDLRG